MKCIFKNLFSFIFIYIIESHVCLLRGQDNYITYDKTITNIISYEVLFELKQQQNLFLCLLFYPLQMLWIPFWWQDARMNGEMKKKKTKTEFTTWCKAILKQKSREIGMSIADCSNEEKSEIIECINADMLSRMILLKHLTHILYIRQTLFNTFLLPLLRVWFEKWKSSNRNVQSISLTAT